MGQIKAKIADFDRLEKIKEKCYDKNVFTDVIMKLRKFN